MGMSKYLERMIRKTQKKIGDNETSTTNHLNKIEELESGKKDLELQLKYYKDTYDIKPTILLNSGRDNKYVYGKIWWYSNGVGSKKKSYRFFLGRMDENKTKTHYEYLCINKFYEKVKPT